MNREERLAADGASEEPVTFYGQRNENGQGSNFSPHKLILRNPFTGEWTEYLTPEHRYQAMKATNLKDHDYVIAVASPSKTKDRGRSIELRPGWGNKYGDLCWYVMYEIILAKVRQHPSIRTWLKNTGTRLIYEDSPTDDIWGWRYAHDYRGKNLLGECWMNIRELLSPTR